MHATKVSHSLLFILNYSSIVIYVLYAENETCIYAAEDEKTGSEMLEKYIKDSKSRKSKFPIICFEIGRFVSTQ